MPQNNIIDVVNTREQVSVLKYNIINESRAQFQEKSVLLSIARIDVTILLHHEYSTV